MKSSRRDLSNATNQSFVALTVWKLELTELGVFENAQITKCP